MGRTGSLAYGTPSVQSTSPKLLGRRAAVCRGGRAGLRAAGSLFALLQTLLPYSGRWPGRPRAPGAHDIRATGSSF